MMKNNPFHLPGSFRREREDRAKRANELLQSGERARSQGNLTEAFLFFQEAFLILFAQYGREHPQVTGIADNLGRSIHEAGQVTSARQFFAQTLSNLEADTPEYLGVAHLIDHLGNVFFSLDDFENALAWYQMAIDAYEQGYGPGNDQVRYGLQKLVGLYYNHGSLAEARAALEKVLQLDEKVVGNSHPRLAAGLSNLGRILREMGDLRGAAAQYSRAVEMQEHTNATDAILEHPRLVDDLTRLAEVLRDLGELEQARIRFERVLALDEKSFGRVHPKIASDLENLASVQKKLGDAAGMIGSLERILEIDRAVFGTANHKGIADLENLGEAHRLLGDLSSAKILYEQALKEGEQLLGQDHPRVAANAHQLGNLLRDLGDLEGARRNYQRALAILLNYLPPEHPQVHSLRNSLEMIDRQMPQV